MESVRSILATAQEKVRQTKVGIGQRLTRRDLDGLLKGGDAFRVTSLAEEGHAERVVGAVEVGPLQDEAAAGIFFIAETVEIPVCRGLIEKHFGIIGIETQNVG